MEPEPHRTFVRSVSIQVLAGGSGGFNRAFKEWTVEAVKEGGRVLSKSARQFGLFSDSGSHPFVETRLASTIRY
jgi:hypothetical protein